MKKTLSILLAALLMFSLIACSNSGGESGKESLEPVDVLKTVWSKFTDDEKFEITGGDSSEANMKTNEAGIFDVSKAEELDSTLGYPEKSVDKIDAAASIIHMLNANTFTCGAYRVKNADDVEAVAKLLKENILDRRWMCGFPEEVVIISVDNIVISLFGATELIESFKTHLQESYSSAKIISEDPIA